MKPIKGEVVDCQVEKVGKLGFFCVLGPMQIFVSTHVSARAPFSRPFLLAYPFHRFARSSSNPGLQHNTKQHASE
jgi:hypothetical protein